MKCPGGLKHPGMLRTYAHAHTPIREDANMAPRDSGTRGADMNVDVICIFNRGEEGFNVVGSIETDIYFALGWVSSAASSILRYGGLDDISILNKHQVRLALESTFPSSFSTDPPLMDASPQDGG